MFIQPIFLLWLATLHALMSTAAPLTRRNTDICSKIKKCSDCVAKKGLCSFDLENHFCMPHGTSSSLTNDFKKCKGIPDPQEPGQPTASHREKAAIRFNTISSHVLEGEEKSSSGRHLTSAWIKNHPSDAQKFSIDSATSLAALSTPRKTLWIDNTLTVGSGDKAVSFRGVYSKGAVSEICTEAIAWSLFHNAQVKKAIGPSYSVNSFPGGPNICVTVTAARCYPASKAATAKAVGEVCP